MKTITFNGQCPACELDAVVVKMRYNICHELECPTCNLRVYNDEKKLALIYRTRGKNEFALKPAPSVFTKIYFTEADLVYDAYSNGSLLLYRHDIQRYLAEVSTKAYKNVLDVLLNSYIDAFYHDKNVENYFLISELAGIDISQAVFRDSDKNSIYLFQFLHFVIACYESDSIEDLEDFACSTQILKFKETYIDAHVNRIKNDLFLQKIALKNLIIALIQHIYEPSKILAKNIK